jgi:hypothetical protein
LSLLVLSSFFLWPLCCLLWIFWMRMEDK